MKYSGKAALVPILALLLLGIVAYGPQPAHSQGIVVAIEPNEIRDPSKTSGTTFSVSLVAKGVPTAPALFGFQATVRFDPAALTVPPAGAAQGPLWAAQVATGCAFAPAPVITPDSVTAFATLLAPSGCPPGFSGDVVLITITFSVDANSVESIFDIDEPNTIISDADANPMPYTPDNGFFSNKGSPVLAPIGDKGVVEGTLLQFAAEASDPDGGPLTWSLTLGTPAATSAAIESNTGVFTWTPTEAQGPGSYPVTITVTDSDGLSDSETFTITVNEPNEAPVLAPIGAKTVDEQTTLSFTATATDPESHALTFSCNGCASIGASITTSGAFSWTPTEAQGPGSGPYTVTIVVTDSLEAPDSETIQITVNEVNQAPVLVPIGNRNVEKGGTLTFTARASDADIPAQTLTFSIGPNPPQGVSITATGLFTWTPGEGQAAGTVQVTIRVSDGTSTDEETISITVSEPQRAPPAPQPFWVEYWWAILSIAVIVAVPVARVVMRRQSQKPVSA